MDVAQLILTVLTFVSILLVGAAIPAGLYCLGVVYRMDLTTNDLLRREARWIVLAVVVSIGIIGAVTVNALAAFWPETFEALPRFWASIVILAFADVLPLWVINKARTWRRLRKQGRLPTGDES